LLLAVTLIGSLIPPSIVRLGEELVDRAVGPQATGGATRSGVLLVVIAIGGLTAIQSALNWIQSARGQIQGQRLAIHAESKYLEVVGAADAGHFDDPSWHDRVQRANREQWRLRSLTNNVLTVIGSLVTIGGMMVVLLRLHPVLVLFALIAVLVPIPVERSINRKLFDFWYVRTPQDRERWYVRWILSDSRMAKDLRAFNLEGPLLDRYRGIVGDLHDQQRALYAIANRNTVLVGLMSGVALAFAYGFAGARGLVGEVTPGGITAVIGAVASITGQVSGMVQAFVQMDQHARFVGEFFDFLHLERLVPVRQDPTPIPSDIAGGIKLENVTFKYPGVDSAALDGVNLHVRPGELMALVGDNGAGKTTIVKLILRFYDPEKGTVNIGGVDLRDADPQDIRDRLGVLFQDVMHIPLSVRDNLTLGRPEREATDDALWAVLQRARADEMVREMPSGLDSTVGRLFEGGKDLSGGEWQRLALARLMYRDADIWILDEPTSSLDPEAEAEIFAELKANLRGRTGLVISHRFNTVRIADRIAVVQDGRISEMGTHEELVALGGRYAYLFELQATAYR
jgi:ATP-binding cassette subfamily B protein